MSEIEMNPKTYKAFKKWLELFGCRGDETAKDKVWYFPGNDSDVLEGHYDVANGKVQRIKVVPSQMTLKEFMKMRSEVMYHAVSS